MASLNKEDLIKIAERAERHCIGGGIEVIVKLKFNRVCSVCNHFSMNLDALWSYGSDSVQDEDSSGEAIGVLT